MEMERNHYPQEVDEAKGDEPSDRTMVDVESPELALETKRAATEVMLGAVRGVCKGLDSYVVFASTAMYLHGKEGRIPELDVPPGDMDIAVFDQQTLDTLRERLGNMPGVLFDRRGAYGSFPGEEAKVLSGKVNMLVNDTAVSYPFEIFLNSRVVSSEVARHRTITEGLQTLTLEGLQNSYVKNLEFESRVHKGTEKVRAYLLDEAVAPYVRASLKAANENIVLKDLQDRYGLSRDDLKNFYKLEKVLADTDDQSKREKLSGKLSLTLAGVKTKIAKREKNIGQLQGAQSLEVGEGEDADELAA